MRKVNSIWLKISVFCFFVSALNAESSRLLSKLLCLLSSFLLNIVSVGVLETHFFIVITIGAFVSREGGVGSSRWGKTFISPKIGSTPTANTQRWPRGAGSQGVWVLELFGIAFFPQGWRSQPVWC